MTSATKTDLLKMSATITRLTDKWYCRTGNHWTGNEYVMFKGRRVCKSCDAHIQRMKGKDNVR